MLHLSPTNVGGIATYTLPERDITMSDAVVAVPMITNDEEALSSIASFDDAIALLKSAGVELHDSSEFGDGFEVVDKANLVDVPFVILGMKFAEGEFGGDGFVVIHLVTEDGRKCIITDGSTGVCKQARKYAEKGLVAGVVFRNGLIRSDYKWTDPSDGREKPATTFYLS